MPPKQHRLSLVPRMGVFSAACPNHPVTVAFLRLRVRISVCTIPGTNLQLHVQNRFGHTAGVVYYVRLVSTLRLTPRQCHDTISL